MDGGEPYACAERVGGVRTDVRGPRRRGGGEGFGGGVDDGDARDGGSGGMSFIEPCAEKGASLVTEERSLVRCVAGSKTSDWRRGVV